MRTRKNLLRSNLLLQKGALPDKCNRRPIRRERSFPLSCSADVAPARIRRQRVALDPDPPGRH